jgi:glycosyltransferase involved in cell wall biosynthesis
MNERVQLAVIMPVFNEEGAIGNVLKAWDAELRKLGITYAIHVYDDGSRDRTSAIIAALQPELPALVPHIKRNTGHGPTILEGYRDVSPTSEWLFQVDSDDEMGPEWFYKLWAVRHDHDFIVGKRYERQSSWSRKLVSLWSRLAVTMCYGQGVFDVNCPYRLMRSRTFDRCFRTLPAETFAPNVIVAGFAAFLNLKTIEIHVPHRSRYSGTVSITNWRLVKGACLSMWQTIAYRMNGLRAAVVE